MDRPIRTWLLERIQRGPAHATLLDPATSPPAEAADLAKRMVEAGSDMVWVGGSTGVDADRAEAVVRAVRAAVDVPVLLFPSGHHMVCPSVDAVLFTSLFNSTDPRFIVGEQAIGAELVMDAGIEAIPTAYLIVEPGMTVGKVGRAEPLQRDPDGVRQAARYAKAARVFGLDLVYLEAGSGAPACVPPEMVRAVKAAGLPTIVGGGIRRPQDAADVVAAGADIVVTGTLVEQDPDVAASVVSAVVASGRPLA